MNRRDFFAALGAALAAPATPHRVYSFLWDNPLVVVPKAIPGLVFSFSAEDYVALMSRGSFGAAGYMACRIVK